MYKIEFSEALQGRRVTLAKCPVATLLEAATFAIAKVRKRLGLSRVQLVLRNVPMYQVMLAGDCFGYCWITKI